MDPAMVNILATVRIVFFSVLVDRFGAGHQHIRVRDVLLLYVVRTVARWRHRL